MRLASWHPIDPGELTRHYRTADEELQLSAAACPVLTLRSPVLCFGMAWKISVADPYPAPTRTERLASKLPPGFAALEMHTSCICIKCSVEMPVPTLRSAAWELSWFLANAPLSYRRFSLFCDDALPQIQLRGGNRVKWGFTADDDQRHRRVSHNGVEQLAEHLKDCAAMQNMSVAVMETPIRHISIVRLLVQGRLIHM